ncbi:MAG: TraR/DksA family transcriptional regulator, partial [Acidimicrobiia bacterium]|nr:TraR/DksA family transcriptional regulator [Acidimicrobiia bacterium]
MAVKRTTAADRKKFRAILEEEQARLNAVLRAHEIEIEEARLAETSADRDADPENADAGAMRYEMQKELAVDLNARDLLAKVNDALARIEDKTYGVCEDCRKPIRKARLEAIPYAALCVGCA